MVGLLKEKVIDWYLHIVEHANDDTVLALVAITSRDEGWCSSTSPNEKNQALAAPGMPAATMSQGARTRIIRMVQGSCRATTCA